MYKLTIITINYNNVEGLKKTFKSIFNQSYPDFEYIVIDGGSSDGSKELIEEYTDKISFWVSERDNGIYNAMNKGIKAANSEYLLFINSGDELFEKNTIEKAISFLHIEDIIAGNLNYISDKDSLIGEAQNQVSLIHMYHDTIWHPSTFIKKKAFETTNFYDENLKIVSDWKWFLLATLKFKKTYKKIDITIAKFYLDGISSEEQNRPLLKKEREIVLKEEFPMIDHFLKEYYELKKMSDYYKNSKNLK